MHIYDTLLLLFWLTFIIYWYISAIGAKKNLQSNSWELIIWIRVLIIIVIIFLLRLPVFQKIFTFQAPSSSYPLFGIVGLIICGAGLAFAVWARVHLGKNWGMPMSLKENPELVTSGPYSYVRHPIYSGFLLAMLGSIFIAGLSWAIAFVVFGIYFIYSAKKEEKIMTEAFPDQYPAYKKQTKMLVPFIF